MPERVNCHNNLILLSGLVLIFAANSCRRSPSAVVTQDTGIYAAYDFNTVAFDSNKLHDFLIRKCTDESFCLDLKEFYRRRNFQFAWMRGTSMNLSARTFIGFLQDFRETYHDSTLIDQSILQLIDTVQQDSNYLRKSPDRKLELEFRLSAIFFSYASKEYYGIERNIRDLEWYIPRKKKDLQRLIDTLVHAPESYGMYEPLNQYYRELKKALKFYRNLEESSLLSVLDSSILSYHPGDSSIPISKLKLKLHALGDLEQLADSCVWDDKLSEAIAFFQRRHGLPPDSLMNEATLTQLNIPNSQRLRQIMINLERMRWMPDSLPPEYLLVNIPEYRLHLINRDSLPWSTEVVVGKELNETGIFAGKIRTVIFSPYWTIPRSIIITELMPVIRKEHDYLEKHHMEAIRNGRRMTSSEIDWKRYLSSAYFQIRQKPGPWNALGGVKFVFPNNFDIYLHDTPARELFSSSRRAFSHGCIRLGDPLYLARYALRHDTTLTETMIGEYMQLKDEKEINLSIPLQVYIVYFTSWVDDNGVLQFRDDLYHHDTALFEEIFGKE